MSIRSVKNKQAVSFLLDYEKIKLLEQIGDYEIDLLEDKETNEKNGVEIRLQKIKLNKQINIDSFRISIARRFAIKTDEMEISVNEAPISKENLDFEYRTEEKMEKVSDVGEIRYWFGFLNKTIEDPELRGLTVFAHGRAAQTTPFHFNLTGGINGQVGLEYLTGQIFADCIDDDDDEYIATDRQSINWNHPLTNKFQEWGQKLVKNACKEWKERKDQKNLKSFQHDYSEFYERIYALPKQERDDIVLALNKIAKLDRIEGEDFQTIANSMLEGFERESVKKVIRKIGSVQESNMEILYQVIKEWDIIAAVSTAEIIFGKIEIIKKFEEHIENRTREKAPSDQIDMQDFIKSYPWLLGNEYEQFEPADFSHERGIDAWIEETIEGVFPAKKNNKLQKRFDLQLMKDSNQILIIELMRPGLPVDWDHVNRLVQYVIRIETQATTRKIVDNKPPLHVYGFLIADGLGNDNSLFNHIKEQGTRMKAYEWKTLLSEVQGRYKEFYFKLKNKSPNDPRLKGLLL